MTGEKEVGISIIFLCQGVCMRGFLSSYEEYVMILNLYLFYLTYYWL